MRCGGLHLNYFVIEDTVLVRPWLVDSLVQAALMRFVCRVCAPWPGFAHVWTALRSGRHSWRRLWALTPHERLRIRAILDAVIADLFGLDQVDFGWTVRDCDHPAACVCNASFARTLDPKGFWRVEKEQLPELRHPVLSLIAFHELKNLGLEKFLALHDGDGWQLPETVRLADYGLGHDDRAKEHQPVAGALGERFLPWQLGEDVEASWEECRRHAELIEKILARGRTTSEAEAPASPPGAAVGTQLGLLGEPQDMRLVPKTTRGRKR